MLRYGQEKQSLNRSQNVKPVNLSKLEFSDKEEAESQYAHDLVPLLPPKSRALPKQQELTTKEISDFCMRVSFIINDMMNAEADVASIDIAQNQSEGKQYEVLPNLFAVSNTFRLPIIIQKELQAQQQKIDNYIDYGFLEEVSTLYFCLGKCLYLWSFPSSQLQEGQYRHIGESPPSKFQFDQIITTVCIATPLPGMDSKQSDKILIVATITQIKIFYFIQNPRDGKIDLVDSNFSVPTDQNIVSKLFQMRKNGRVFYGGSSGHVNEVKYQEQGKFDIFSLLQGERRKLKKNDHESETIIKKLLPGFLKFTENKSVIDFKLDTERNILYSVCTSTDEDTLGETIIDVFDLGVLSNKFVKLTSIKQSQVMEMILDFWSKDKTMRRVEIHRMAAEHKIIHIQPISISESQIWHLLLITQNGLRIFIQFEILDITQPNFDDMKSTGANSDILVLQRFTKRWKIAEIMHFPEQTSFFDVNLINKQAGVFSSGTIQSIGQNMSLDSEQVMYDSHEGILPFILLQSYDQDPESVETNDRIIVNFLKRNESTLAYLKQIFEASSKGQGHTLQLIEGFSQLHIPFERTQSRQHQMLERGNEIVQSIVSETVLSLQCKRLSNSSDVNKLLGINQNYMVQKGLHATSHYSVQGLSDYEKQVYLQPSYLHILTSHRLIEVINLRPIDFLAMLVFLMRDPRSQLNETFEEYVDLYSVRETCGMLLQIFLEKDSSYFFSRRVIESIKNSRSRAYNQPKQHASKSTQALLRKSQLIERSSYFDLQDGADQVFTYILNSEERNFCLQLLIKYGDSVLSLRPKYEIHEESLEGTPYNIQEFSIKHYVLYQYAQRILRPFWNIKLAYKLPSDTDDFFKPSLESLTVPKKKLECLLEFIRGYEVDLCGPVTNIKTANDKSTLNQSALPVILLKSQDQQRLEIMEKNSLKNLKHFITRCIQSIDMLEILTFSNDKKMFATIQKAINDPMVVIEFASLTFKDLVTLESNSLIRRFLEASVQAESQNSDEAQTLVRQKYAHINKVCDTFFTKQENVAFIGTTLLQAAKKERNLQKKEELLKQALDSLSRQPINIDMNQVPLLLIDNGNYTSLAELTLRKIKALESISLDQRHRIMGDIEYQHSLDQCYSIILSLFAAIDQSIQKNQTAEVASNQQDQDYIQYFLTKLNAVQNTEMKISLREKIMRRIEQFNDEVLLTAMFDYLISKPQVIRSIETLPKLNDKTIHKVIDNAIKSEKLSRPKFDSIVKILMHRGDFERFLGLTLNTIFDRIKLSGPDGQSIILSILEKQSLLETAKSILQKQKASISSEAYLQFERELRVHCENIDFQILIMNNITEYIELLKFDAEPPYDKQKYATSPKEDALQNLVALQNKLALKLYSREEIAKLCRGSSLLDSDLLNLQFQGEAKSNLKLSDCLQRIINITNIVMVYLSPKGLFQFFIKKIEFFKGNKALLRQYLKHIQNTFSLVFSDVPSIAELNLLMSGAPLQGTRFEIFEYCFVNLLSEFAPSNIYLMFKDESLDCEWANVNINDEVVLKEIASRIALLKCWINKEKLLFGATTLNGINNFAFYGEKPESVIFIEDLIKNGMQIMNSELVNFNQQVIQAHSLTFDKALEKPINECFQYLQTEFEKMLLKHVTQPNPKFSFNSQQSLSSGGEGTSMIRQQTFQRAAQNNSLISSKTFQNLSSSLQQDLEEEKNDQQSYRLSLPNRSKTLTAVQRRTPTQNQQRSPPDNIAFTSQPISNEHHPFIQRRSYSDEDN